MPTRLFPSFPAKVRWRCPGGRHADSVTVHGAAWTIAFIGSPTRVDDCASNLPRSVSETLVEAEFGTHEKDGFLEAFCHECFGQ